MFEISSVIISLLALVISLLTARLTLFQRGTVRMTQPTVIFLGRDGPSAREGPRPPKVFLRTLLYASSQRGRIVESMYVRLLRAETGQTFSIWVYGEDSLARGSGLFVDRSGVVCNHHFLLHEDGTTFQFLPGDYDLEIYASLVGDDHAVKLFSTRLTISDQDAEQLRSPDVGIYFDWRPESRSYHRHVRSNSRAQMPPAFQTVLRDLTSDS